MRALSTACFLKPAKSRRTIELSQRQSKEGGWNRKIHRAVEPAEHARFKERQTSAQRHPDVDRKERARNA